MTNITNHNLKMTLLTVIPLAIAILGILSSSYKLPFDVMGAVAILTAIEHYLNGNTSEPITPASQ